MSFDGTEKPAEKLNKCRCFLSFKELHALCSVFPIQMPLTRVLVSWLIIV